MSTLLQEHVVPVFADDGRDIDGRSAVLFDRSIDIQVSRLRRKLGDNPKDPRIIKTVWGGGYLFTPDVTQE